MKTAILLLTLVLLAGVLLTPSEAVSTDGSPVITRVSISETPRAFEMDDGSVVSLDRRAIIVGNGFYGTAQGPFVRFEDDQGKSFDAVVVILKDETRIHAWPPKGTRGRYTMVVENPDRLQASATVEF